MSRSRYAPDAASTYSHRFHAGNVGDVWKHCALVEVLRTAADAGAVHYLDTHAGEGRYPLGPTGEWSEGIGRLWAAEELADDAVGRYRSLCRALGGGGAHPDAYPGSPLFARATLGADATLELWERDAEAFRRLSAAVGPAPNVRLIAGDGLERLDLARDATVVLVDPPWTQKSDWTTIPDAVARAARAAADTCFILWYPVKSLTRPNAMHARFEAAGVPATIAELITTPLKHQRNRLNGSGVLLVRPPAGTLAALAAAAPVIGARCATRGSAWSLRVQAW